MTIQQLVDPSEREGLAELAIQDSLKLRSSKRRDAISWRGTSLHSLNEAPLLLRRQSSLAAWCRASTHRFDAAIAVGVRPTLYESSAPANCISDLERLPPLQHQQHAPQPIPLHRVRFFGDQTREPAPIAMLPFDNVHMASVIGSRIIAPQGGWRNMGKADEGAQESSTSRIRLVRELASTPLEPLFAGVEEVVTRSYILPLRHRITGIRVDVAIGMSGFEQEAVGHAAPVTIGDVRMPVVVIEDLLVMKALAGRPQDEQDIRGLIAAQGDAIDWPRCLALARQLGEAVDIDVAGRLEAARVRKAMEDEADRGDAL